MYTIFSRNIYTLSQFTQTEKNMAKEPVAKMIPPKSSAPVRVTPPKSDPFLFGKSTKSKSVPVGMPRVMSKAGSSDESGSGDEDSLDATFAGSVASYEKSSFQATSPLSASFGKSPQKK
jgi:hypothetical protein